MSLLLFVPLAAASAYPVRSITAATDHVTIALSEAVSFSQTTLPGDVQRNLKERCYVDLTPAILDRQAQRYVTVNSAAILQVRAAQFRADTVRVVLDLASARSCQATRVSDPPGLQIAVGPATDATPRAGAPAEATQVGVRVEEDRPPPAPSAVESRAQPPDMATPAAVETLPAEEAEAESAPPRATATIYPPAERPSQVVSLEEAYLLAVSNEEQVAIAARELAKAKLLPWRAVALMAPRGEIGAAYSRNKDEIAFNAPPESQALFGGSSVIRPRNNWLSTFQVTQPLIEPSFFPSWRLGKDAIREEEGAL